MAQLLCKSHTANIIGGHSDQPNSDEENKEELVSNEHHQENKA